METEHSMKHRLFLRICLFFVATYLHGPFAISGEFLIYNNNATPTSLITIFTELSALNWASLSFVGADIRASTAEEGTQLGQALALNNPEYFTLQAYKAGSGTSAGLSALLAQLSSSKAYYLIQSHFDNEQGVTLGSASPPPPMFGEVVFDDPASFAEAGHRTVKDGFSFMNDSAAQQLINNTTNFSDIHGLSWSNNGKQISSAPVIEALEKIAANPSPRFRGLDFSNSPGITTEIAPAIDKLLKNIPTPNSFSFDFSYISGENSNDLVAAVINNLPSTLGDLNNAFKFNHGNLTSFSEDWWRFFLNNSNVLFFAQNNLGNSMPALANAFKSRPSSTSLWLDLSSNYIDDDGAIAFFAALGDYLEANHPTDSFYFAFGGNPLGDRGMDALVGFLQRFSTYVNECPWNQVAFNDSEFSPENWSKLFDALKTTSLSSLSLSGSNLSDPRVMGKLGELLVASPKIWFMELRKAKISDEGMTEFANAITNISHLPSYMWLQRNSIGAGGATALATALKTVKIATNVNLYLNRNYIGTNAAKELLSVNDERAIAAISLGRNPINVDDILPLYAYQKGGGTINLSSMNLTDSQAITLANIIKDNPVFESLIVNDNQIGDEGMLALSQAFITSLQAVAKPQSSMKRLDLSRQSYRDIKPVVRSEPSVPPKTGRCTIQ